MPDVPSVTWPLISVVAGETGTTTPEMLVCTEASTSTGLVELNPLRSSGLTNSSYCPGLAYSVKAPDESVRPDEFEKSQGALVLLRQFQLTNCPATGVWPLRTWPVMVTG